MERSDESQLVKGHDVRPEETAYRHFGLKKSVDEALRSKNYICHRYIVYTTIPEQNGFKIAQFRKDVSVFHKIQIETH